MNLKISLIGDGGVGKTSYINRITSGAFSNVNATNQTIHKYETNNGTIDVTFVDIINPIELDRLDSDAILLFFDMTNINTYNNLDKYIQYIPRETKVILCANKVDCKNTMSPQLIQWHKQHNCCVFMISCKSNYQYEKPLLESIRSKFGEHTMFIESPSGLDK